MTTNTNRYSVNIFEYTLYATQILHALYALIYIILTTTLPWWLRKRLPGMQETQVRSLGWEDPLEKEMATHASTLPGKSHGQRSLVGYSPWGRQESDPTERLHFYFHNNLKR